MGDLNDKTVVFSCNWGAYSAIEAAGANRIQYEAGVRVIRLMCAGRTHPGLILGAFGQGAKRVVIVTCGHDGDESLCRFHTGNHQAVDSVATARGMLHVLGIDSSRLEVAEMRPGDGQRFVDALANPASMPAAAEPPTRS
jgi:F420-non-reducing hydrogenase iron-sulfur subunit